MGEDVLDTIIGQRIIRSPTNQFFKKREMKTYIHTNVFHHSPEMETTQKSKNCLDEQNVVSLYDGRLLGNKQE